MSSARLPFVGWVAPGLLALGLLAGCTLVTSTGEVECPGDSCVDESGGPAAPADPGPGGGDGMVVDGGGSSSTGPGPTVGADSGGGEPVGGEPPPGDPAEGGCGAVTGTCGSVESGILTGVRRAQAEHGCELGLARDARIVAVARDHSRHQAEIDGLDADTGAVFERVADSGVELYMMGAAFSVTREGAEDVLARWAESPRVSPLLSRCDAIGGVGVAPAADGDVYVTLVVVH